MTGDERTPKTYGERLKAARKAARMNQTQLAKLAGVHQTQISDLENDKYEGSAYTAQIAHALGIEALWLAIGKGSRKRSAGALDAPWLADVLAGVEMACEGRQVPPERRAELAAAIYRISAWAEKKPELTEILQMIRALL